MTDHQLQQRMLAVRRQLLAVDELAAALEHHQATDGVAAHRQLRSEVERLAHLTEDLFALSCIHAGLAVPPVTPEEQTLTR